MSALPKRPILRWHGGKWRIAAWINQHLPKHRIYVEPFAGAASVLLNKPRAYNEVINDLDGEVVGLFRVLRDPVLAAELRRLLELTPFARDEFELSYQAANDPVEAARRLICRSFMGFGSNAHASTEKGHRSTGFRAHARRSGSSPAVDWSNYPVCVPAFVERLRGVVIENRDAREVMAIHDGPETLIYADPPYLPETRSLRNPYCLRSTYRHELSADDHRELLDFICGLRGMVVLSGYASALYDDMLPRWRRVERRALAEGARERVEVLWINPAACEALNGELALVSA